LINRNKALHGHTLQTKNLPVGIATFEPYMITETDALSSCNNFLFSPSMDEHFSRELDPIQLENWLAMAIGERRSENLSMSPAAVAQTTTLDSSKSRKSAQSVYLARRRSGV
jgi:hypothetical protein